MLEAYWPSADAVNACVKNEAETADVSVLLAVHQPTPLVARAAVTNRETVVSEKQLLDAFLSEDVPAGYILCPITGPSGVGKSHVIRWLDAQLQRSKRYKDLLVIRIPKSASLRKVVELILEPLKNNPRYAKPRDELSKAVAEVNASQIIVRFIAELQNALADRAKEMRAQVSEDASRGAELRSLIGHAEQLPKLFRDAVLHEHYADTVFNRIISRAIKGRDEESIGGETDTQFFGDDLLVPESCDISEAAFPVRNYYLSQIAVADATRREPIAKLLNSVVDRAISHVFRLEQSSGGLTLQDIILGVRESLLEDGKELVLLVEDFAALSGIQEALLNVCIQEGTRDGKQVYATMRTALALTDGYLTSRETILTRAQRVWMIGNAPQSEAETKAAVVEMVGAYLNAARWGEEGLKERFSRNRSAHAQAGWLPIWHDDARSEEEAAALEAFGQSEAGFPLFPFNRAAIERLVEHHLLENAKLTFNPRRVINEILRNTLLDRDSYIRGEFPPAAYHGLQPNGYLANLVRQLSIPDPEKRRLQSTLVMWGGNAPDAKTLAHVQPLVFRTFGVPTPEDLTNVKFVKKVETPPSATPDTPTTSSGTAVVDQASGEDPVDPKIAAWVGKLDRWATGEPLIQADARAIRNALAELLQKSIDGSGLRIPEVEVSGRWIAIAGASNNPTGGRELTVCTDYRDEDGTMRQGMFGALRYQHHGSGWDYPEGDDDYVAAMQIVDDLRRQLEPMLIADAKAAGYFLGNALLTQARIAGMQPPVRIAGPQAMLAALFDQPASFDGSSVEPQWDQLRTHALNGSSGRDIRKLLQDALRDRSASYQGNGRTPFAIDLVRIYDALQLPPEERATLPDAVSEDIRMFLPSLSEDRIWARVQPVIALLRQFRDEVGDFLDDEKLDKNAFVADLKTIVHLLQKTQCWPSQANFDVARFGRNLTEFQTSPYAELVNAAAMVSEAERDQLPRLLNALGVIDLGLIQRTLGFLKDTEALVSLGTPRVEKQMEARRQSDPMIVATDIIALFDRVAADTTTLGDTQ
ncbi:protein DpdH [Sphingopyxis granuli]|uniref:protein DpdH n=1 Tax=Sphingopyxis granuli TaxID=267128 RepID=UPI000831209B|nr:protein DpdH [Sphingopyxis granuli]